jgi:hypothetical protein
MSAEEIKHKLSWPAQGPVVGVHIRVGDSCNKWAVHFGSKCIEIEKHMCEVKVMVERYAATGVFVASDDAGVVQKVHVCKCVYIHIDIYIHMYIMMYRVLSFDEIYVMFCLDKQ